MERFWLSRLLHEPHWYEFSYRFVRPRMLTEHPVPFFTEVTRDEDSLKIVESADRLFRGWRAIGIISMVPWAVTGATLLFVWTQQVPLPGWQTPAVAVFIGIAVTIASFVMMHRHRGRSRVLEVCLDILHLDHTAQIVYVGKHVVTEDSERVATDKMECVLYPVELKGVLSPVHRRMWAAVVHIGSHWMVLGVAKDPAKLEAQFHESIGGILDFEQREDEAIRTEANLQLSRKSRRAV